MELTSLVTEGWKKLINEASLRTPVCGCASPWPSSTSWVSASLEVFALVVTNATGDVSSESESACFKPLSYFGCRFLFKRCVFRNEPQDLSSYIGHHISALLMLLWAPPGLWSDSLLCLSIGKCLASMCFVLYFLLYGIFFFTGYQWARWKWHFAA